DPYQRALPSNRDTDGRELRPCVLPPGPGWLRPRRAARRSAPGPDRAPETRALPAADRDGAPAPPRPGARPGPRGQARGRGPCPPRPRVLHLAPATTGTAPARPQETGDWRLPGLPGPAALAQAAVSARCRALPARGNY